MSRHASMNRVYRLVWSQVRSAWVPLAETARGRRKSGRAQPVSTCAVVGGLLSLALTPLAYAAPAAAPCVVSACSVSTVSAASHPVGGQVVSGRGSISQSGDTTTVQQSSQNLFLDWLSFNVGSQETVNFVQPSANAIAVNEISSTNGSQILGHLNANGQVWLLNPNGIVFGEGAEVNVGALVASTLNNVTISGNTASFSGDGAGSIVNEGTINAANGGSVALLGKHVDNQGTITARLGTVALGAGSAATLTFSGNSLVKMQVDQSTLNTLAKNGGVIQADGGTVILSAGAKNALLASVVNNTGLIEARTVENHDGTIELLGGMTAGTVNVGGTLDASAPNGGNGGFIETNAAHVEVANDAKVTTAAAKGLFGTWLIDPTDFTVAPTGGDITGAALSNNLSVTNFAVLSSFGTSPVTGGGSGGNINVNDTVSWSANTTLTLSASNNVNVNSSITARGASAGLAINPNTSNINETASGTGTFNLGAGASISLFGANAALSIATPTYTFGAGAQINLPNVSSTSTTALVIGGTPYTVINSLGETPDSTTGTDLQGINGNLNGHYVLGSNIDASATATWSSSEGTTGFTPIGDSSGAFFGRFDGFGHTISNLTISQTASRNYVGLFGAAEYGIQNVGLLGGSVSGGNSVGALVGSGTVSNSYATATVSGLNDVGGLVGSGGTINSYAKGTVTGTNYVGGLVGSSFSTINSYATGTVSGANYVGGLVGGSFSTTNSYATGKVSGSKYVGGLAGINLGTINNSYATGTVSGSNYVGGLVGRNGGSTSIGAISNSYATGSVSGAKYVGGLVGFNSVFVYLSDYGSTISNSYATGSVSGSNNEVGGLVGGNVGAISNSYATGSVSGSNYLGGLVGGNGGTISNSYATGSVSGANYVGGLVGYNGGTIVRSYAAGDVTSSGTHVGGLVGGPPNSTNGTGDSFWDVTTSGQATSAGGTGMTTAQMQAQANFTSATSANGNANPGWDFANTWVMYDGHTYPLLRSFMTPLTVTANNATITYSGSAYSGGNGVSYSVTPNANLLGTVSYSGSSQGAFIDGGYEITPGGLYSNQQGYIISYGSGALVIKQLASVAWVGGATGDWSTASNWAGGAIPDLSNVAAVTIPKNTTVTYDAGVPGTTILTSLTDSGKLVMAAGDLTTTGNLSTAGYQQTGGTLDVGGTLSINSKAGAVTLGTIDAAALTVTSTKGAITQAIGTVLDVTGATSLSADNGVSGAGDVKYNITLAQPADSFGSTVASNGMNINLLDSSTNGLILGNTTATATLTATSRGGAIAQAAATAVDVTGATSLTANNGQSGAGAAKYNITLAQSGDSFGSTITSNGLNIDLLDSSANGLTLGNTTAAGTLTGISLDGAITQAASTALNVNGATSLTADNGASGAGDVKYNIILANANHFVGAVSANGLNIDLLDRTGALKLGNTTATGTLADTALGGTITQVASTALDVSGATTLTADNGGSGSGDVKYAITLAQAGDRFTGAVKADGSVITLKDATALTVILDGSGATSLTAAGALNVSGTVGTTLTPKTTGANHATTFGATTVGTSLNVTSTGAVTETASNILTVDGEGTTTISNPNVTVNGVKGALIPAP